jgi:hypothetical protein
MRGAAAALAACGIIVALAAVARAEPDATLAGTIVDRATRAPVAGATIAVGPELAASDDAGRFELALAPGRYTIEVTADWLVPARRAIVVAAGARVEVTIEVDAAEAPHGERIEVVDVAPTAIGETRVDAKFARAIPTGGDAASIVQSLPAVARPSAGTTDIVVWGAAPNESRVFVDGVPVPALFHTGGYRSSVGNDLVGDIHLAPAAFGVDRGRAIGGVIDIALADPASLPAWRAQADLLDGSVAGRTQLGAATIAAAVRQSWLDRAVALVENPSQLAPDAPVPRWSDAQVALRVPLASDIVVTAWLIGALDSLDQQLPSDDPATSTDRKRDRAFARAQVAIRRDVAGGFDRAMLWAGRDRSTDDLRVGLVEASRSTDAWVFGARALQSRRVSPALALAIGVDVDGELADLARFGSLTIPAREGDIYIFGQPPGDDVAADAWRATTIDAAAHAAIDVRAGALSASLGARADTWLLTASRRTPRVGATPGIGSQELVQDVDPRGSLQWRLGDELVLRGDAGVYHQARDAADTSAVFGTPTLGIEQAIHAIVGARWVRAPLAIEVAGYARWLDSLVARDLAVTPPLAGALTQLGTGDVVGAQVTARVLGWRGVSGWLAYTLSRSRRQDAPDQTVRFFDHDQTHGLIAVAGWEKGAWTFGARVRVATGEPRTPVIGAFFDSRSGRFEPIVGEHNGTRLPAFFAADARVERRFGRAPGLRGAVYVDIQNIGSHANAEEIIYNADFSMHDYLTGLPMLAIVGARLER